MFSALPQLSPSPWGSAWSALAGQVALHCPASPGPPRRPPWAQRPLAAPPAISGLGSALAAFLEPLYHCSGVPGPQWHWVGKAGELAGAPPCRRPCTPQCTHAHTAHDPQGHAWGRTCESAGPGLFSSPSSPKALSKSPSTHHHRPLTGSGGDTGTVWARASA